MIMIQGYAWLISYGIPTNGEKIFLHPISPKIFLDLMSQSVIFENENLRVN